MEVAQCERLSDTDCDQRIRDLEEEQVISPPIIAAHQLSLRRDNSS